MAVRGWQRRQARDENSPIATAAPELPSSWKSEQLRKSPHEAERAAREAALRVVERWNAERSPLWSPTIRCGVVARRPAGRTLLPVKLHQRLRLSLGTISRLHSSRNDSS